MSLGALCGILFVAGIGLSLFKVSKKFALFAFLLAGVGITGTVAGWRDGIVGFINHTGGHLIGSLVGAGIGFAAIAILVGIYLWSKAKSGGGLVTNVLAFLFPSILTAIGLGAVVHVAATGMATLAGALPAIA